MCSSLPPASHYRQSARCYDGVLRSLDYPDGVIVRKGEIKRKGRYLFVSEVLAREPVGLREIGDDIWLFKYGPLIFGTIKGEAGITRICAARLKPTRPRPVAT